jgi:hypothetical protein
LQHFRQIIRSGSVEKASDQGGGGGGPAGARVGSALSGGVVGGDGGGGWPAGDSACSDGGAGVVEVGVVGEKAGEETGVGSATGIGSESMGVVWQACETGDR